MKNDMVIIMDNKNFNLEGPLEENEKSSKDKIVEDVKLLFQDVKNTKNDINKNKLYEKLDLVLRIVLGLVSLSTCVLSVINMFSLESFGIVFTIPLAIVCFVCSMILFFYKKKSIYKIITTILLVFLLAVMILRAVMFI